MAGRGSKETFRRVENVLDLGLGRDYISMCIYKSSSYTLKTL